MSLASSSMNNKELYKKGARKASIESSDLNNKQIHNENSAVSLRVKSSLVHNKYKNY